MAAEYGRLINRAFAHIHLLTGEQWFDVCKRHNLSVQQIIYYNGKTLIALHDLFLPFTVADKFMKQKTGTMVLFPRFRRFLFSRLAPHVIKMTTSTRSAKTTAAVLIRAIKK